MLREDQNPFSKRKAKSLIDRPAKSKREELPTFGEEMALLDVCTGDRAHLRAIIIIASDTGLRHNELVTLSWEEKDIDFENGVAIILYPNPVKDILSIDGLNASTTNHLSIVDVKGKVIAATNTKNAHYEWNVQALSKGIYYLRIESNGRSVNIKFIKQ